MDDSLVKVALLNWIRGYYGISKDKSQVKNIDKTLESLKESLERYSITDLRLIHQSKEYYTLSFKMDGIPRVKQFTTEEVEKHL